MKVHVRGLGLVGSFLVRELSLRGINATWDDDGSPSAWAASTGSVSAHSGDSTAYDWWMGSGKSRHAAYLEEVRAVYVQRSTPAALKTTIALKSGAPNGSSVWLDPRPALQFNVQEFVGDTRRLFAEREVSPPTGSIQVGCRGVGEGDVVPVWGWSVPVRLEAEPELLCDGAGRRKAYHLTDPGRPYARLYLYPMPMTTLWWAGSATRLQRSPARLDDLAAHDFGQFLGSVRRVFGEAVRPEIAGAIRQGWRPKPREWMRREAGERLWFLDATGIRALPLYKSGVLLGPQAAAQIANVLEKIP